MSLGNVLKQMGRTFTLLMLVAFGTILLVRFAPGYFSDARELDAKFSQTGRSQMQVERIERGTLRQIVISTFGGWAQGDFGISRQYGLPVLQVVRPRLGVTASLLSRSILAGWLVASSVAWMLSAGPAWTTLLGAPFTLLLAVPTGAMVTVCLLADTGGPVLVLTLLLAARDFKFLHALLRVAWQAPHLLQARAQGLSSPRLAIVHVLPNVLPQMLALATLSLVTALSAIVPVEVIFDIPGLGQLAWSAAMNRDLPVLTTVTLLMAAAVALAGLFSGPIRIVETA